MPLFFAPNIVLDSVLSEEESVHCIRVLRHTIGDSIELIDGKGVFYKASIVEAHPKHCRVAVLSTETDNSGPFYATIAVAPTKNFERIEWFVEKATEVGIAGFAFVKSANSERRALKRERVEKIVVSALKQSVKAWMPSLEDLLDFQTLVKRPFEGQKFICHCHAGEKPMLHRVCKPGIPVLILIGPEGDFSTEEVKLALENGFQPASLGNTRLRTETAAFVAAHIVQLTNS